MISTARPARHVPAFPGWIWMVYGLVLWQILLWAQNPGLMSDDSGEMVAAAFNLGLPHPPGYPLIDLLGKTALWLPVGTPAFRMNLISQLAVFLSMGIVLWTCNRLIGPMDRLVKFWFFSTLALVFLSYRSLFAQAFTAKGFAYTWTLLFTCAVVWLRVGAETRPKGPKTLALAWFIWATALGNHWQTQVLWIPFLLHWVFTSRQRPRLKTIFTWAAFIVTGVSTYLYLPLRAALAPTPCWGNPTTLHGFYWVVSRQLTAGNESWTQGGHLYWEHLLEMVRILGWDWLPGFGLLSIFGLWILLNEKRGMGLSLGILLACLWCAVADFTLHDASLIYLVNVYLVSSAGVILLCGSYGLFWLISSKPFRGKKAVFPILLLALGAMVWLARSFQLEDKSRYTIAEDLGVNVLKGLPRGAVFLAEGDHYVFPIYYQKYVLGMRSDLVFEPSVFLVHPWGWRQLEGQMEPSAGQGLEKLPVAVERFKKLAALKEQDGKGLFYSLQQTKWRDVLLALPGAWIPEGLTFRWKSRTVPPIEMAGQVLELCSSQRLRGIELFQNSTGLDFSSKEIYRYYAEAFFQPAQWLQSHGREDLALRFFEKGLAFDSSPAVFNNMAVIIGQKGYPAMARQLCGLAMDLEPRYKPAYFNMANAFLTEGKFEEAAQCLERARRILDEPVFGGNQAREARQMALSAKKAVVHRSPGDYEVFGRRLEKEGLPFLSEVAKTTALLEKDGKP